MKGKGRIFSYIMFTIGIVIGGVVGMEMSSYISGDGMGLAIISVVHIYYGIGAIVINAVMYLIDKISKKFVKIPQCIKIFIQFALIFGWAYSFGHFVF